MKNSQHGYRGHDNAIGQSAANCVRRRNPSMVTEDTIMQSANLLQIVSDEELCPKKKSQHGYRGHDNAIGESASNCVRRRNPSMVTEDTIIHSANMLQILSDSEFRSRQTSKLGYQGHDNAIG